MQQLQLQEAQPIPTPQPTPHRRTAHPPPHRPAPHRATAHPPPPHRPAPPQPLQPPPQPRPPPHLWAYCKPSFDEAVASRSYRKNLERVTSESSSSPSVTTGSRACEGAFSPRTTAADAPLAIAKDIPAAPHIGKAFERLRLEACLARAMTDLPDL